MNLSRSLFAILCVALAPLLIPHTSVAQSASSKDSFARITCDGIELHHLYSSRITLNLYDRAPTDYTHLLAAGDHIVFVDVVPVEKRLQRQDYYEGADSALRPESWVVGDLYVIDRRSGEKSVYQLDAYEREAPFLKRSLRKPTS